MSNEQQKNPPGNKGDALALLEVALPAAVLRGRNIVHVHPHATLGLAALPWHSLRRGAGSPQAAHRHLGLQGRGAPCTARSRGPLRVGALAAGAHTTCAGSLLRTAAPTCASPHGGGATARRRRPPSGLARPPAPPGAFSPERLSVIWGAPGWPVVHLRFSSARPLWRSKPTAGRLRLGGSPRCRLRCTGTSPSRALALSGGL